MLAVSKFTLNLFIGIVISAFNRGREQVTRTHLLNDF